MKLSNQMLIFTYEMPTEGLLPFTHKLQSVINLKTLLINAMTHNLCTISYENQKHNDYQHILCTYLMKITNMMIINISSVHITYLMKITNIMILNAARIQIL